MPFHSKSTKSQVTLGFLPQLIQVWLAISPSTHFLIVLSWFGSLELMVDLWYGCV
jgi:hypothetical protein